MLEVKVVDKIERKLDKMPEGSTFKYMQLGIERSEYSAGAKAIERLIKKGTVKRVSTGVFYKPKQSAFGELKPSEEELIKPYLFQDGKRIAYITGGALYNKLGLTTQVPKTIKVASREKRVITTIGKTQVKAVKSYIDVTNENYYLLELLDALKDFKAIPDLDQKAAITLMKNKINELTESDQTKLIKYAIKYPPRVAAFLGALLDFSQSTRNLEGLKMRLNPLSKYDLAITPEILPTATDWNIY